MSLAVPVAVQRSLVLVVLLVATASSTAAAAAEPSRRDANRLAEAINVRGVQAMGTRFSCAAVPAPPSRPQVVVWVRSAGDRDRARSIAEREAAGLGLTGPTVPRVRVRAGEQVRRRGDLLRIARRLDRSLVEWRGEAALVAPPWRKSRCGRVQLYVGDSPRLNRWARAQQRRYGASRIRVVRAYLGSFG